MGRPKTSDRSPLKWRLARWSRGVDVEPELRPHLVAVAREALREAERLELSVFESVAAGMALKLYATAMTTSGAIPCARALGEVIRALRALRMLSTAGRVVSVRQRGRDVFRPPDRQVFGAAGDFPEVEDIRDA
jgi:hypothetical protein